MDHSIGSTLAKGHIQGVFDQFASQMVGHGPADHAATEGVYDHREVEEARMGRHVGDIGYPQPVSGRSGEVPVDQIGRHPALIGSQSSTHGSATRYSADRGHTHQASNTFASCAYARLAQFGMDARRTVGTVGVLMDQADPAKKHSVLSGPPGDGSPEPDVVAAGGDIQQTAHPANGLGGLMRLYEREDPGGVSVSRANQAAAFARISRSILSCLFSRPQTAQLGPFFGSQAVFTPALIQVVLFDPVADGLCGGLELLGQCFSGCGRSERDRPSAGGSRWIGGTGSGHVTLLSTQEVTCPLNRVNSKTTQLPCSDDGLQCSVT